MDFRHMTATDEARLKAHPDSERLFRKALTPGGSDPEGCARLVAELSETEYRHLRTLLELDFLRVDDGRLLVPFTVSSIVRLGYLS
jgi:hypothetical protein